MAVTERASLSGRLTEEEFLALPKDGFKYELVNGEAVGMSTGLRHDEIVAWLLFLLRPFITGRGKLFASDAGFRMVGGNIRSPDVSFVRSERFPEGVSPAGFADFAPDLCVEVLSPTDRPLEMFSKLGEYFDSGVTEVWLLDMAARSVTVYRAETQARTYGPEENLDGGDLLPGFHRRVADLFSPE
jgi:Uma2 family endonuclease